MGINAVLWLLWLAVGAATILRGAISPVSYGCVWLTALMYMALYALDK